MRTLKNWMKAIRWHMCLASAFGAWVISLLSDGHTWFDATKLSAMGCIVLVVAGSSLYHYGAAHQIYTRKDERLWIGFASQRTLIVAGTVALLLSVVVAAMLLNRWCVGIIVFDATVILLYAHVLGRHWLTKNVVIALVATTPGILGWLAGHRLNPAVPWLLVAIGAAYGAREIVKDIDDIRANRGRRVTLPMVLDIVGAMRVAAALMACSAGFLLVAWSRMANSTLTVSLLYATAVGITGWLIARLIRDRQPGNVQHWIFRNSVLLTAAMLCYRFGLS